MSSRQNLFSGILFAILFIFLTPGTLLAQKKVSLSGYMKDASSGEALINATIYVKELAIGAQTNNYGFYSISMPAGSYTVIFSYVGFTSRTETINLIESRTQDVEMQSTTSLKEIEVTTTRRDENVKGTEMGSMTLSAEQVKTLPVVFGETDILKSLQLMPGVKSAGEGSAGFYVRGGGPDQNLMLLDDAVVYNTGHLFGFFSVFNTDALKNVTLIKGGMPANYGGRLSSVVDVSMKEGNMKEYHAEGGIGLIASRLTLEGPIKKDKGSFMLSGRRTYIDVLIKPFVTGTFSGSGYYFYDANLKANYKITKKDRLYLSGYFGRDKFKFASSSGNFDVDIPWGNSTATLRWNHQFNDKLFLNTTAVYNDYQFAFSGGLPDFYFKLSSGIRDYNMKSDLDYYTSFNHHIKAGIAYTKHKFIPNQISGKAGETVLNPDNALIKYAHEAGAYIMDDFDVTKWFRINAGVRYSWFGQIGPYTQYQYGFDQKKSDSTKYNSGELVQSYGGWEPRVNLRFTLSEKSSIKASVARAYQYIHLVSNNGSTLPTDIWLPSTLMVNPQQAWQYSLGYFRNFFDNKVETSVEVYYKDMKNQIEYRANYQPNTTRDPELDFVFGNGKAYGAEFFINKTRGKFTGWIGYTLSWTYRTFPDLNDGRRFPAKYDRRHDLSIVGTYQANPKWTFSSVFVFGSGNAVTLPIGFAIVQTQLAPLYSDINAYRLFPYHRLDLSAIYTPKPKKPKRWQSSWAFSIYNVYSRQNPYFLYADLEGNLAQSTQVKIKQVSIFPILPSVTYNFSF
ncbi:MAG: TonB-dependent receptor [Sphingobacteriales bacterium]|nr:MAG: TonB-dependent receptor [Sphingobacteriales bacterium]